MFDAIELWQVPLLVAGIILVGNLLYEAVTRRSPVTAPWIKAVGGGALVLLVLVIIYQLVKRDELPIVVSLIALALEGFVAWVALQNFKDLRLAKKQKPQQQQSPD